MEKKGIVAFAFGVPETILSNKIIADLAAKKAKEMDVPIFTQTDIKALPGVVTYYANEKLVSPLPTLRIAREAVGWAVNLRISELLIAAAKPHLWRCLRDLNKAVAEAKVKIKINYFREIDFYDEKDWFCADSTQDRTKSRTAWNKRELILKVMPFFIYKRIAS